MPVIGSRLMMQLRYNTYHWKVMSKAFTGLYADIQLLLKDTGMRYPTVACTSEKLHLFTSKKVNNLRFQKTLKRVH